MALGLHPDLIERIGENTAGVENRLCEVLKRWLKQEYDTKRHGLPSWTLLVKAVAHKTGGANPALAQQLAQAHNGLNKIHRIKLNCISLLFLPH